MTTGATIFKSRSLRKAERVRKGPQRVAVGCVCKSAGVAVSVIHLLETSGSVTPRMLCSS